MSTDLTDARIRLEGFVAALAQAGIAPGAQKHQDFLHALTICGPGTARRLYWIARITLLRRAEDLTVFDRVFAQWFGDVTQGTRPPSDPRRSATTDVAGHRGAEADPDMIGVREGSGRRASPHEILSARPDVADGRDAELLAQLRRTVRASLPQRPARRRTPARRTATLDLRRTVHHARHSGGEVTRLHWLRRPGQPRAVLMLIDVSGSLRATSTDALRCAHAVLSAIPGSDAYTFGTRLTHIAPALRHRDCEAAVAGLSDVILDANGGTRIGAALDEFLADGRRVSAARDAVVILVSDGLERGDPDQMAAAVSRIARLAHRLVWWSPLACDPEYRPATRGMAAVLDDLDDLVGVRDLPTAVDAALRLANLDRPRQRPLRTPTTTAEVSR